MKQFSSLDKIKKNKPLRDCFGKIILKKILHPILMLLAGTKVNYKICKENKYSTISGRPVIFAVNHTRFQDTPIICKAIKKQAYILAGKQDLTFLDNLFFNLNGSVFVDRKDKDDMNLSKFAMESYLRANQHLIVFPEGSWNLTDNLLVQPMKWGIIDVARNTNAQIIPVSLHYDDESNKCYVSFGKTILPESYCDNAEAITTLRDELATLRWYQMEKSKHLKRFILDVKSLRKEKMAVVKEYPKFNLEYEQSVIFKPYKTQDEVFAPIKKLH